MIDKPSSNQVPAVGHPAGPESDAETNRLIEQLASRAQPVTRLASPLRRTLQWLVLASLMVAAIVVYHGLNPDWLARLTTPDLALEWLGSVLTGSLAAFALFQISVPGRSPSWAWLPLPAALVWLAGIAAGCMGELLRVGTAAWVMQSGSWECAWAITFTSVPLGFVLLLMVRHAGVVRPAPAAVLAGLSAAALSAAGVSMFHHGESALMVLIWHLGAVAVLALLSGLLAGHLFAWIGYARR
ncbi:MAG: NrsF family protein [Pseudomarimonas sp.]